MVSWLTSYFSLSVLNSHGDPWKLISQSDCYVASLCHRFLAYGTQLYMYLLLLDQVLVLYNLQALCTNRSHHNMYTHKQQKYIKKIALNNYNWSYDGKFKKSKMAKV